METAPVGVDPALAFEPIAKGSAQVTVSGPAGVLTMGLLGTQSVTVTDPDIVPPGTVTVGAGLQLRFPVTATLNGGQHGGIDVTVTSENPSRVLLSADGVAAGAPAITIHLADGEVTLSYFVQGVENQSGQGVVTISAPGFTPAVHLVQVVPAGIEIAGLPATVPAGSPNANSWWVQVGLPCPDPTQLCDVQNVRAGSPGFVVTVTSNDGAVLHLRSDEPPATGIAVSKPIQPGWYFTNAITTGTSWGLALEPLTPGSALVTVTGPPGTLTMSVQGAQNVTVTAPE
jgi:hypothetical protein